MATIGRLHCATEDDTLICAAALARTARVGDIFALSGPLGSGKTTFARGFVRALVSAGIDVPSPTFTLVQTYSTPIGDIWHCDLYRLDRPQDGIELGLEDAFASAITLIEWPERLGVLMPQSRLMVTLSSAVSAPQARQIDFDGEAHWTSRLSGLGLTGVSR